MTESITRRAMNSNSNLYYTVTFKENGEKIVEESNAIPSKIDSTYSYEQRFLYANNNQNKNRDDVPNFGRWMVFIPSERVDEIWNKVKQAVFEDKIRSAKVSTANNVGSDHVLSVYAYNSNDFAEVKNIYETLVELDIVARDKKIYYQLEEQENNNQHGSDAYKYSSHHMNMVDKLAKYSHDRARETGYIAGFRNLARLNDTVKISACNKLINYFKGNGNIKFSETDLDALCEEKSDLNNLVKECDRIGFKLPKAIIDYDLRKEKAQLAFYLYSKQI